MMLLSRRAVLPMLATIPCVAAAAPLAGDASPWVDGLRSRARLIAGGIEGGTRLAGIEIDLAAGFKTYWRQAGDSGLPPAFDWSGSTNLDRIEVLWPTPARLEDPGGTSYGYLGSVILPVRVTPREAEGPVGLALKMEYGVCKDLCIPAEARMALDLPSAPGGHRAAIEAALARVPVRRELGAPGPLAILRVEPNATGEPRIEVAVRAPAAPEPQLFVEGPETWYLGAAQPVAPAPPDTPPDRARVFRVDILERPKDAAGPVELRLTLVAGDQAVETEARLDAGPPSR